MRDIVICETPDDAADAAADVIQRQQAAAIAARGVFRIALAGGGTPRRLYELLASAEWKDVIAWESWEVFWGDERAVPPAHAESNFRAANDALLTRVPVGEIWRMPADAQDLNAAAADYARTLRSRFEPGSLAFDVVLLGMGADGHTASLFPDSPALESGALVEAVTAPHVIAQRLTLTLGVLNSARFILFLVAGAEKARAVERVLREEDFRLPATRVIPRDGECWWLLDHAAASLIR